MFERIMCEDKNRRRHQRQKVSQINPLQLSNSSGALFFVVPIDKSDSGFGCIFSGIIPPIVGHTYLVSGDSINTEMEVRWVVSIGENRFRLGLVSLAFRWGE
jgi:hypothetical protein